MPVHPIGTDGGGVLLRRAPVAALCCLSHMRGPSRCGGHCQDPRAKACCDRRGGGGQAGCLPRYLHPLV